MPEKVKAPGRYPLFKEVQRFKPSLLLLLILLPSLIALLINAYGMIKQLFFHESRGDNPMADTELLFYLLMFITIGILLFLGFVYIRLITEVYSDGVYIKYFPLHLNYIRFSFEEIETCKAISYNPIKDYGGWGIRKSANGRVYNIRGNQGVLLQLKSGEEILIGSQNPEKLANIIGSYLR